MSIDPFDHVDIYEAFGDHDGGFGALFNKELHQLQRTGRGFDPILPGLKALAQMNAEQYPKAMDSLFYSYFCDHYREQQFAVADVEITGESTRLQAGDFATLAETAVSARGPVEIDSALLWRVVKELRLQAHRNSLLRSLLTHQPLTEEELKAAEESVLRFINGPDDEDDN